MPITISDPHKPSSQKGKSGALAVALRAIAVDEAVTVTGMTQPEISARVGPLGRKFDPKRKFRTHKLPDGSIEIARVE